ncbi:MAG: anthranilate synthase component I family protein, partial [Pricia sp.]|nr:anthranilate synthase component I family protein [Pricia sp.]
MNYHLKTNFKRILADTITPVSVYLKIRDRFPNSILLESSDYHANDNSFSYICCNPIASIKIENETVLEQYPDGKSVQTEIDNTTDVVEIIHDFSQRFETENNNFKFINNGLFGYMAYDAVRYYESIDLTKKAKSIAIPDIYYAVYQNIIAINHFKNEAYIFAHCFEKDENTAEIEQILNIRNFASYNFTTEGEAVSNLKDEEYKE